MARRIVAAICKKPKVSMLGGISKGVLAWRECITAETDANWPREWEELKAPAAARISTNRLPRQRNKSGPQC
jgi:hypothetical protein